MSEEEMLKITLVAGGVGGAKMAEGFAAIPNVELSVIGNIADDDEFHGLWISPDIDTLTYSLADLINRNQGWGVRDEGLRALEVLKTLGQETWMTLGDRDFGLHIYRTMRRIKGDRPSQIAKDIAEKFGIAANIILPTDDVVKTRINTADGWMSFQEYFVKNQCEPEVCQLDYEGIETAKPTFETLNAIKEAGLVVIAPSNPLVSIAPIMKINGISAAIASSRAPVVAVSPLIAGKVVKGPADRMMTSLGMRADVVGIAEFYSGIVDMLYVDSTDKALTSEIEAFGLKVISTDILMKTREDKMRLALDIVTTHLAHDAERVT